MSVSRQRIGDGLLDRGDHMIGTFGDVVFLATADTIRTFQGFSRTSGARWGVHEVLANKPRAEYIGPIQDEISFSMRFDVRYGMNPRLEMTRLLEMSRDGQAETLIIGGSPMGTYKWYIESITQSWTHLDGQGNVLVGVVDLTMKEYVL